MKPAGRLALYAAGLVVAFVGAFALARAVVPDSVVESWERSAAHDTADAADAVASGELGLTLEQQGYLLSPISAPATADAAGELRFQIQDSTGTPVTEYQATHEEDLHLIVVRTDGSSFQHVHPRLDVATGSWSTPWQWPAAGTYRVFVDFRPAQSPTPVTLSRTVEVAGPFVPVPPGPQRTVDEVAGYTATLAGELVTGQTRTLTVRVSRAGEPVRLQPYLGASGHLVVLRDGDLAYLHVHPDGQAHHPEPAGTVGFEVHVPSAGKYLLYLDFRVDGDLQVEDPVRTATFVLDTREETEP